MLKRKLLLIAAMVTVTAITALEQSRADEFVRGYWRSNGTYVSPHFRSRADGSVWNNYSTYPNINPYTGSIGTRHYPSYSPSRNGYGHSPS